MLDFTRRGFLLRAGLVTGGIMLNGCIKKMRKNTQYEHIQGSVYGPDKKAGHLLRTNGPFAAPGYTKKVHTLIIGAGISGLSAGRWLKNNQHNDFEILELENHAGGNAYSLKNKTSSYPLGAHYITTANNDDQLFLDFLVEHNVITHFEQGLPYYNDFYLCFDPEERLLINGQWQEGLVPQFGTTENDKAQIKKFFEHIKALKSLKGSDGKYVFNIPIDHSSTDDLYRKLDQISFIDYLVREGYTSKYLLWYLDYCCKDDYGQKAAQVSAWAGLGYFAGHKGKSANAADGDVLTWPEGNGWLVNQLRSQLEAHVRTSQMVYSLVRKNGLMEVCVQDLLRKESYIIQADRVIMASPQFVNKKILGQVQRGNFDYDQLSYAPWMVSNLTLENLPEEIAAGMCWDNVPYNTPSVGYVSASHQSVQRNHKDRVITFYLPLSDAEPRISRLAAYARDYQQWLDIIIPEIEFMHPGITPYIKNADVWVWGHGMVVPKVNYLWGEGRKDAQTPIDHQIFFAHTDLSGISLFEEGFHQGIRAASEVLQSI